MLIAKCLTYSTTWIASLPFLKQLLIQYFLVEQNLKNDLTTLNIKFKQVQKSLIASYFKAN